MLKIDASRINKKEKLKKIISVYQICIIFKILSNF